MTSFDLVPHGGHLPRHALGWAARPLSGTTRSLLAAAVLVNAAVLVVGTTFAAFTGKQTVAQPSSAGSVSITLSSAGTAAITSGVAGLGSGDWFERLVTVSPGTGLAVGSWSLSTAAAPSSLLDTTATHGLRLKVDHCSAAWNETVVGGVHTYTCPGTLTPALAERDVTMTGEPLAGLGTGENHLRLTLRLAATAPDSLQGLSSTVAYTFAGVQRAGQAR